MKWRNYKMKTEKIIKQVQKQVQETEKAKKENTQLKINDRKFKRKLKTALLRLNKLVAEPKPPENKDIN